ncbi:haloacid dehalogenase type II [Kineosporia sp. R_H_3]|uniref:haloacid dehalogenase type II n=1 Tax=Kineosporia sp. R_H_3 TaxID=1961848 RepID=UPI000B4C0A10|nr:haloacid dehalogenase type II [Kineosporia sp. R_H_3]
MPSRAVLFDVNETLSDMAPLAHRFSEVGAGPHLLQTWFAALLRDGFALAAVGELRTFADLGREGLRAVLHGVVPAADVESAVEHVMSGFAGLGLHPDVADGVRALADAGVRLATLSNGGAAVGERLLRDAGLRDRFERVLSVEDAGVWKPAAGAYRYAVAELGVAPSDLLMVAVHPWDLHGAAAAGLSTAWVNRDGRTWPETFRRPDHEVAAVGELVGIAAGPAAGRAGRP